MSTLTSACTKSPGSMSTQWPARKTLSPCIFMSNSSAIIHSVRIAAISPKGSCTFGKGVFPLQAWGRMMVISRAGLWCDDCRTLVNTTRSISIPWKGTFVPHFTFNCWHMNDRSWRRAFTCASKATLNVPGPKIRTCRALLAVSFLCLQLIVSSRIQSCTSHSLPIPITCLLQGKLSQAHDTLQSYRQLTPGLRCRQGYNRDDPPTGPVYGSGVLHRLRPVVEFCPSLWYFLASGEG